jgi:ribosomal protein S18 acetylase RimI-like enzyme
MDLDWQNWNQKNKINSILTQNKSDKSSIYSHLQLCNKSFLPHLSSYINIEEYAKKLFSKAEKVEISLNDDLIALLAFYKSEKKAYISNFSVVPQYMKTGLAYMLFSHFTQLMMKQGIQEIHLEVKKENTKAIKFYENNAFSIFTETPTSFTLVKNII